MKLLLKTSYPCLVKTNTEQIELEENDTLEIQDESILFIYPQNTGIPFYININSLHENEKYSILNRNENKIIFLESEQQLEVTQKENLNFSGKNCSIYIKNNNLIQFETDQKILKYNCQHSCKNYKVFKVKEYACIQFENNLYVYSMSKSKLLHFSGDQINFKDNELTLTKKYHDSFNREKTAIYQFDDEIKTNKEEFMYTENSEKFNSELLPYKLLESVKAKDYTFVMNSLSAKLKEQIDDNQIKQFFGNISAFLPLSSTEFITISNHQKNFVKFNIIDNKIDDILIDGL